MSAKVLLEELHPDTQEKVKKAAAKDLPQPPPRPDTTGMPITERNRVMHGYYEANKPDILLWLDTVGESEMLKAWKIQWAVWRRIAHRWRPENFPATKTQKVTPRGKTARVKREKKPPAAAAAPKKAPAEFDIAYEVCIGCPVLQAFKGYRLAIGDILLAVKKSTVGVAR